MNNIKHPVWVHDQFKFRKRPRDKGLCIIIYLGNILAVLTGHLIEITFLCAAELYNQHQQNQTCT